MLAHAVQQNIEKPGLFFFWVMIAWSCLEGLTSELSEK